MLIRIANPIYDAVFKYLMSDKKIAKFLISSIIGEEIIELDFRPQESNIKVGAPSFTVVRMDFVARIKTATGEHRAVTIELQKAKFATDIIRFRKYLSTQYSSKENTFKDEHQTTKAMQIYSIYFLGYSLGIADAPVLGVFPSVTDVATGKSVATKSEFIDGLNHKSWIIQITCLPKRRRTELEKILSVFDQSTKEPDRHILLVDDETLPEECRPLFRQLVKAAASQQLQTEMEVEDEIVEEFRTQERKIEINKKALEEKDKVNEELRRDKEETNKINEELRRDKEELRRDKEETNKVNEELKRDKEETNKANEELKRDKEETNKVNEELKREIERLKTIINKK